MKYIGLIIWILSGYLVAMTVLEWRNDPALAVLAGCLATSVLQRFYTASGAWK